MSKQEHPYAQVLRWIADGESIQRMDSEGIWYPVDHKPVLGEIWDKELPPERYRLKPRTITINSHEVPEPMRVAPELRSLVWCADFLMAGETYPLNWDGDELDCRRLVRGLCHTTREAAEIHARALLSFTSTEQA